MKRILSLALALALLMTAALAEENSTGPFGSFELTLPADAALETNEGIHTVVRGQTRVVVQVIPQELTEDGQAQVRDLLTVYRENTTEITDVQLISGVYGAMGLIEDHFAEGVHQVPVLILTDGELLILSGYDLDGDTLAVHTLLTELLAGVTLAGEPILPAAAQTHTEETQE